MYKKMFEYFIKRYGELNKREYHYFKRKFGLELLKLKRLKLTYNEFVAFINWLYVKKKLITLNFLPTQLNDFHASTEYQELQALKQTVLHHDIMQVRMNIINKCALCKRTGFINQVNQCKCMKKFLKIRDKMRMEKV